ncbi:MAG: hypothetical protein ACRDA7_02955 [Metamycoplasmataceae bacterium]
MNKKSLFLIGGFSTMAVIAPIVVATSCSTSVTPEPEGTKYINVTVKATVTDKITSQDVTANPITQETLAKIFTGVDATTFAQFTSAFDTATNKITLTPKTGYKFGTAAKPEDKLESIALTIVNVINVTPKTAIEVRITDKEVAATPITHVTLNKAFNNVTEENMKQFTSTWDTNAKKIVLTPAAGSEFVSPGTAGKIESIAITTVTVLEIEAIPNLASAGITATEVAANPLTLATLQKAFTGVTAQNMANFTATVTEIPNNTPKLYFITLTAKDNFGFGNQFGNQLPSKTFNAK